MATPITWRSNISSAALGSAPTALSDANVVADSSALEQVVLSANITGGTTPTIDVIVYFWDSGTSTFKKTGDLFQLDPLVANVRLLNTNGLILGFTATANGGPSAFNLALGVR